VRAAAYEVALAMRDLSTQAAVRVAFSCPRSQSPAKKFLTICAEALEMTAEQLKPNKVGRRRLFPEPVEADGLGLQIRAGENKSPGGR